ncbi:MAG: hypothetical protein LC650_00905 [Actinobacteria bacterium]|nr:hypothetical protein [Actinomycetota bacterium]
MAINVTVVDETLATVNVVQETIAGVSLASVGPRGAAGLDGVVIGPAPGTQDQLWVDTEDDADSAHVPDASAEPDNRTITTDNGALVYRKPFLDLTKYETQSLKLDGTEGSYATAPDVNLFVSSMAHAGEVMGNVDRPVVLVEEPGYYGPRFHRQDHDGGAGGTTTPTGKMAPVSDAKRYHGVIYVRTAETGRSAKLKVFYDVASSSEGSFIPLVPNEWTKVSIDNFLPLAGATKARLVVYYLDQVDGDVYEYSAACIREATGPAEFIPSSRIDGDLDIRVKGNLDDWSPTLQTFASKAESTSSNEYDWAFRTVNGGLNLVTDAYVATSSVNYGTPDGVRVTREAATGNVTFYELDGDTWVQLGSIRTTTAGPIDYVGQPLVFGALGIDSYQETAGSFDYLEIRDGIDGPVVARFDGTEDGPFVPGGVGTQLDDQGNRWSLNGSAVIDPGVAEFDDDGVARTVVGPLIAPANRPRWEDIARLSGAAIDIPDLANYVLLHLEGWNLRRDSGTTLWADGRSITITMNNDTANANYASVQRTVRLGSTGSTEITSTNWKNWAGMRIVGYPDSGSPAVARGARLSLDLSKGSDGVWNASFDLSAFVNASGNTQALVRAVGSGMWLGTTITSLQALLTSGPADGEWLLRGVRA